MLGNLFRRSTDHKQCVDKGKKNAETNSPASSGSQGYYMQHGCFLWRRLDAAPSIFLTLVLFVKNNF